MRHYRKNKARVQRDPLCACGHPWTMHHGTAWGCGEIGCSCQSFETWRERQTSFNDLRPLAWLVLAMLAYAGLVYVQTGGH